jgi:hypothetical protein
VPSAFVEAVAAVNRTIILRLERNLCLASAVSAYHSKHLALCLLSALAGTTTLVAAVAAADWLILKAFFRVKFLFACAEDELLATVFAR